MIILTFFVGNVAYTQPLHGLVNGTNRNNSLSFSSFVNEFTGRAFKRNILGFPTNQERLRDPKINSLPSILAPRELDRCNVTTLNSGEINIEAIPALKTDEYGIQRVTDLLQQTALIYLPKPYIIAGSFHMEAYPHDTSAISWAILELIKEGKLNDSTRYLQIVKDQLENFLFQTERFGFPLNGNRGYYATRSQTNIFPRNVLQYYLATKDKQWLIEKGIPLAEGVFNYWTSKAASINIDGEVGYRWIAHGRGPCFEVMDSNEAHNFYYFKVLKTFVDYLEMPEEVKPTFARGFDYRRVLEEIPKNVTEKYLEEEKLLREDIPGFDGIYKAYLLDKEIEGYEVNEPVIKFGNKFYKLTGEYYINDRASRTSGYDTNHLYGPFNSFTYDFVSVDHNILLYSHAKDLAKMYEMVGDTTKACEYKDKVEKIKKMIMKTLWNEETGMFFEFDSKNRTQRINYPFLGGAYALFTEMLDVTNKEDRERLIRLVNYIEKNFEGPAGLFASTIETGLHWDKPYVWPVHQQYIVYGLREYAEKLKDIGFNSEADCLSDFADRISIKYLISNYADWLNSNGTQVGEKVISGTENLLTGYATGSNYTWNLTCVRYLCENLSNKAKEAFNAMVQ